VKKPIGDNEWEQLQIASVPPPPEILGISRIELDFPELFHNRQAVAHVCVQHFWALIFHIMH
jgi:hypothetical protein